jgi:hypothetical protein
VTWGHGARASSRGRWVRLRCAEPGERPDGDLRGRGRLRAATGHAAISAGSFTTLFSAIVGPTFTSGKTSESNPVRHAPGRGVAAARCMANTNAGSTTPTSTSGLIPEPKDRERPYRKSVRAAVTSLRARSRKGSRNGVMNRFLTCEGRSGNFGACVERIEPLKVAAHCSGSLSVSMNPMRRFFGIGGGHMITHAGPNLALTPNHGF